MISRTICLAALLAVAIFKTTDGQVLNIECPFPEGQSVSSEEQCSHYKACEWVTDSCIMADNSMAGYRVSSQLETEGDAFRMSLTKIDPSITLFDADIPELSMEIIRHEDYHLQIKISDPSSPRYEVPVPLDLPSSAGSAPIYVVEVPEEDEIFGVTIKRLTTSATVFELVGPLTFEDQFIQFTIRLPSADFYGFGENSHTSLRHSFDSRTTYPLFARDQPNSPDIINQYGVHPYYQVLEDDEGNMHSVLFMNSNAMEYSTFMLPDGSPALTLRTIGGIIDLHLFFGPTPEDVNMQYTSMVGYPAFPPYWSLGFHLSRYGYTGVDHVRRVRESMVAAGIPQDTQTFDIDYMERFRDFTYDNEAWGELPALIDELHNDNVKVTLILDPALVVDWPNYLPASRGRDADVFIKWMSPDLVPDDQAEGAADYVVGYVWPDTKTVFPDFLKPETQTWWKEELVILQESLQYDAIWIDMNEPANFGTNLDKPFNYPEDLEPWSLKCPYTKWDSPPYPTLTSNFGYSESKRLSDKTICMSTSQTDGNTSYLHYDTHSLFGWSETVATYNGLQAVFPDKRQVVLSRSTFPGSGKYAVHWLGDNTADWTQMAMSVVGMLEFNMFGIPMVGADICGFFNEPSEELCIRWMQLGAFYPFSRNHNTLGTADQDPATTPALAAASREVLLLRYKYLPYLYRLFHDAHMYGQTVVRPMFSLDPTDVAARDVDDQFTWGTGLMVAPILQEGATARDVYFTQGLWYDILSGALQMSTAGAMTINAPLEVIPVYVAGGTILPYQEPATTTVDSRGNGFGLTVALDESQSASGSLFWDDGEAVHVMEETYMADFVFSEGTLTQTIRHGEAMVAGLTLETVQFFGFSTSPSSITVNDSPLDSTAWTYDDASDVLSVSVTSLLAEPLTMVIS